ncbi:MAG: D-amino-acid transaminase [Rhodospirillaceae bacterium]|jgi:D-alanine transaminase
MGRIAYINGRYLPQNQATVHIEDRGYNFADGVYEVIAVHNGALVDEEPHIVRLRRSLNELKIDWPVTENAFRFLMREIIRRNGLREGMIYLQITRGVAPRDHAFPKDSQSSLMMTTRRSKPFNADEIAKGVRVITIPDIRWKRNDIKSISLLGNVLGKQQAREAGAYEAWMFDENGDVTEGTSSNAWIVSKEGELVTRQLSNAILSGITRLTVLKLAEEKGIKFVERAFSIEETQSAKEAFLTSTTSFVKPIVQIDDKQVADGKAGPLCRALLDRYGSYMDEDISSP